VPKPRLERGQVNRDVGVEREGFPRPSLESSIAEALIYTARTEGDSDQPLLSMRSETIASLRRVLVVVMLAVTVALQTVPAQAQGIFSGGIDFDGDGQTDVAIFRPSTGGWYIRNSTTAAMSSYWWGMSGDIPVPDDYDGDGRTDIAIFRPSTGGWYIRNSTTAAMSVYWWGMNGDIPVPDDYDHDGQTDIASILRPASEMNTHSRGAHSVVTARVTNTRATHRVCMTRTASITGN
jgi:hypothetical protein